MRMIDIDTFSKSANFCKYKNQKKGHYESYFLRANHPSEPRAFWVRYTIFSPKNHPEKAQGELWAMYFDGITGRHYAAKKILPMSQCFFDSSKLNVQLDSGDRLTSSLCQGKIFKETIQGQVLFSSSDQKSFSWELSYDSEKPPLNLQPLWAYECSFPAAKVLVGKPFSVFNGIFCVGNQEIQIQSWLGSQNHNWGYKHTDEYAWGQVVGFDQDANCFLEVATARLKMGPFWTPFMTPMTLVYQNRIYEINGLIQTVQNKGHYEPFCWSFRAETGELTIEGVFRAAAQDFIGLRYLNPPGGEKICMNTKIASCEMTLKFKKKHNSSEKLVFLSTSSRAAFEIIADRAFPGVEVVF